MKKKILSLFNKYVQLNKKYNLSILSAANTFYMILLILPLNNIGFEFSNLKIIDFLDIYKWGILFLINLVFVGTRYLKILKETSNKIYNIKEKSSVLKYLKTLFLVIIIIMIATTLIIKFWFNWIMEFTDSN